MKTFRYMFPGLSVLLVCCLMTACGGGGGGSSSSRPESPPPPTPPEDEPIALAVIDSMPVAGSVNANPQDRQFSLAHPGHSDLALSYDANCTDLTGTLVRRKLFDLSTSEFDQLLEHRLTCTLEPMNSYTVDANGTRANDAAFRARLEFSTGTEQEAGLTVLDEFALTVSDVNNLFETYVSEALFADLELSGGTEALLLAAITDLAEANWDNLVNPKARYPVRSQRVSYLSRNPDGEPDDRLTGLIATPVTGLIGDFTPRDRLLVLTHATGSTPGDLNQADAWFILANLFAARGYLVIAPDNYGRGGTADDPETYLMSSRTAVNAIDLVRQVIADVNYRDIYDGTGVSIIGYSQGGHSAMALWQLIETSQPKDLTVLEVYTGGAPYNLYGTFRGVVQHLADDCNEEAFCRYVDTETTVPFATDRILPGFLAYTDTGGLALDDLVTGNTINPEFVDGFLNEDAAYDRLKTLLQLSSFTNIESVDESLGGSQATIHLYHSDFDRLVPVENTLQLDSLLSPHLDVVRHENHCNSDGYEIIFNLTDKVGVVHSLCGLSVLDDAMEDLF